MTQGFGLLRGGGNQLFGEHLRLAEKGKYIHLTSRGDATGGGLLRLYET